MGRLAARGARFGAGLLLAAVVVTDQAVKLLVASQVSLGTSVPLIPGILVLTHVRNPGIAFSLLYNVPLIVPAAIAVILVFFLFSNVAQWWHRPVVATALALVSGGAIGNLIDRLRVGAVIDYVDLGFWPVFNLADTAVVAGTALLILTLARRPQPGRDASSPTTGRSKHIPPGNLPG